GAPGPPAPLAERDEGGGVAGWGGAGVWLAWFWLWARAGKDVAPPPATRHDLAACLPGRCVAQRSVRPDAPARGVPHSPAPGDRRGGARLARCATRPVRPCWLKSCPP